MPRQSEISDLLIPLDPDSAEPLYRQVYRGIRDAVLSGRLPGGIRIPSTRRLADDLRVSRTTVLVAFEQLVAEGYVVGSVGSGSFVASELPDHLLATRRTAESPEASDTAPPRLARRVEAIGAVPPTGWRPSRPPGPFRAGIPPLDQFPRALWARYARNRYRTLSVAELHYGSALGYLPLREAIATDHAAARGVRSTPERVIVVSSAQEALELACRVLLDPGEPAWLEDPAYNGARGALLAAEARIVPVPVDADGLVVERGIAAEPNARLVYLSPSHQYPLGVTMSLERRVALLDWARRQGAWILEDDYDSEYRYAERPLTALQGLDTAGRVIYIGTFSKTLFPSLRLAYLVVPDTLREAFFNMRRVGAQHAPTIEQAILADFLVDGHYARHLRRTRAVCAQRRDALLEAARREAPQLLEVSPPEAGLHAVAWLPPGMRDTEVSTAALRHDAEAAPLSNYYLGACPRDGLIIGFAGFPPKELGAGMRRLAAAIRETRVRSEE